MAPKEAVEAKALGPGEAGSSRPPRLPFTFYVCGFEHGSTAISHPHARNATCSEKRLRFHFKIKQIMSSVFNNELLCELYRCQAWPKATRGGCTDVVTRRSAVEDVMSMVAFSFERLRIRAKTWTVTEGTEHFSHLHAPLWASNSCRADEFC